MSPLAQALYAAGQFECALVEFHRAHRLRQSNHFEEWINRCEETIKAFLLVATVDMPTVGDLLNHPEARNWRDVLLQVEG